MFYTLVVVFFFGGGGCLRHLLGSVILSLDEGNPRSQAASIWCCKWIS